VAVCLDLSVVTQGDTLDEAELGLAENPTVVAVMELDAVA